MSHHHHPGRSHPATPAAPSLLRASVLERLAVALALSAALWLAVWWAAG
jgi:hypothetical protein